MVAVNVTTGQCRIITGQWGTQSTVVADPNKFKRKIVVLQYFLSYKELQCSNVCILGPAFFSPAFFGHAFSYPARC